MIKTSLAIVGALAITFHVARLYARYIEGKYARMYMGKNPQPAA